MGILLVVVAALAVFAIAAVVIGREARRLAAVPVERTFNFDDAVAWVCDHVSDDVAAVLSPDDVRQIIDWHLEYFRLKGVAGNGSGPHLDGPVVVTGAESASFVMKRSADAGTGYTAAQVNAVLEAQMGYLTDIGAVGPLTDPGPEP
ncbi:MAG: hypothetical protein AB1673_04765 [Actinomycetota bacterium]